MVFLDMIKSEPYFSDMMNATDLMVRVESVNVVECRTEVEVESMMHDEFFENNKEHFEELKISECVLERQLRYKGEYRFHTGTFTYCRVVKL